MKKSFFKSAVDSVSKLLSVEEEDTNAPVREKPRTKRSVRTSPPQEASTERPADGPKALDMAGLERNVQRLIKQRGEAMVGRVRVLRFDELTKNIPLQHIKEFLVAIDTIVRRHLSAQDNLRMVEGGACLIVFGARGMEQADETCAAVRADIEKLVAARPELSGKVQVASAVVAVNGIVQLQDQAAIDGMFDAKEREQEKAVDEPLAAPAVAEPERANDEPKPVEIDLTSLYEQLETQNQNSPVSETDAAQPETLDDKAQDSWTNDNTEAVTADSLENWEQWLMVDWDQVREEMASPARPEGHEQPGDGNGDDDGETSQQTAPGDKEWSYFHFTDQEQLAKDMGSAENVSVEDLKSQVDLAEVVARPVWDLESKKAAAVACIPVASMDQNFVYGDALVASNPMGVVTLGHDRLGVHWACRQADGPPACVPVHFESLATMRNRHFLFTSFLEMAPEARRSVLGELLLPADIYSAAVEDVVRLFQPFVGRIIVNCDLNWRHFGLLRSLGIRVAGFSLAGETGESEDDLMGAMADFAAGAKQSGIDTYVKDLPSRNLAMAAAAVGVRYAFSTPRSMADAPSGPISFRLEDLY